MQARSVDCLNSVLSSPYEGFSIKDVNSPVSAISRAAFMNAVHATRESAPPTEILRTPRSVNAAKERFGSGRNDKTFTALGATALTMASICFGSVTPGAQ